MKLCASLIVRDELGRYLPLVVEHLLGFCDEVRILDDGSDDNVLGEYARTPRVAIRRRSEPGMFTHEGRARQELLEWTLAGRPTHVLAIDADELVSDGARLRERLLEAPEVPVWWLEIQEVWRATRDALLTREDGGWRSHPVPLLWRVPEPLLAGRLIGPEARLWRIADRQLACSRVPTAITRSVARAPGVGAELLHFGWADESARQQRYQRYAVADGGRFHAGSHLESILWPDRRCRLRPRPWPAGLESVKGRLLDRLTAEVPV